MSGRVLIVDDHPLAREGLRAMLNRADGLEVVGEASSGEEAVSLAVALTPDIVLMDIRLGAGMDGLAAAAAIRTEVPASRVLMLTLHDAPEYVRAALAAGATGYVLKDASADELVAAVRQVLEGRTALPLALLNQALAMAPASRRIEDDISRLDRLTPRERQVLDQVADGLTNKAIARQLDISPGTVKAHVERVIAKLGVADRTQAAVLATRTRPPAP
ncbi:response regulator [Brevundimonas sp.]|uniref:response regulator n=1 Tax=Brevundimonas sp. TaxID=1871086 RepID=UPI003D1325A8